MEEIGPWLMVDLGGPDGRDRWRADGRDRWMADARDQVDGRDRSTDGTRDRWMADALQRSLGWLMVEIGGWPWKRSVDG